MKTLEEKIHDRKKSLITSTLIMYVIAVVVGMQFYRAYLTFPEFTIKNLYDALNMMMANMNTSFIFMPTSEYLKAIGAITLVFFMYYSIKLEKVNKKYMKDAAYGTSRWANKSDIKNLGEKTHNIILADNVKLSTNTRKTKINNNILLIGTSGSGKTRFFVKPNLMEIAQTESQRGIICTDPKGELAIETAFLMEKHGYKVKIFNIKDFNGNCWNPFHYFTKETDILSFVKSLIENTNNGQKGGDPFWDSASILLFNSIFFYLTENCNPEDRNLLNVKMMLGLAQASEDNEEYESKLDMLMNNLEEEQPNSKAVAFYKDFKKAAGKTLKSIIITCVSRLNFIGIKEVDEMLSKDEFELDMIGYEKTIVYIIIPDDDSAFNFLSGLFIDQMFSVLIRKADVNRKKPPIQFILDEFANIGKLNYFCEKLSTIRSRNISAVPIVQNIQQIENLYKGQEKVIIENCNTKLILGTSESAEWVSKKLGKMTIDNKTSGLSKGKNKSSSSNESQMGRELLTADEVERMDKSNCLILTQGGYPIIAKKYNIEKHKLYKELGDINEESDLNYDINMTKNRTKVKKLKIDIQEPVKENSEDIMRVLANSLENELDGLIVESEFEEIDNMNDDLLSVL